VTIAETVLVQVVVATVVGTGTGGPRSIVVEGRGPRSPCWFAQSTVLRSVSQTMRDGSVACEGLPVVCGVSHFRLNGPKLYHRFIFPPLPLASNAAGHIFNALYYHPLVRCIQDFKNDLLRASKLRYGHTLGFGSFILGRGAIIVSWRHFT
jgi:hypothetical protein